MATILDKILRVKEKEVENLYEQYDRSTMLRREKQYSLIEMMKNRSSLTVISEFKRSSPSKGIINDQVDIVEQAETYLNSGAQAISILTDQQFFSGSFDDLRAVQHLEIPLLCKDFIIDEIQIDRAYYSGADIILLIVSALPQKRLEELYEYAKSKRLDVLVEIHDEAELDRALEISPHLIGINNRNLKTFTVNLERTVQLAPKIRDAGKLAISESGISSYSDVKLVSDFGANGILVGETFMTTNNCRSLIEQFTALPIRR